MKKVLLTIEIIVCVFVLSLTIFLYQSKNNIQKDIANKQAQISEIETDIKNEEATYSEILQELEVAKNDDATKELELWQRRLQQLEAVMH